MVGNVSLFGGGRYGATADLQKSSLSAGYEGGRLVGKPVFTLPDQMGTFPQQF